MRRKLSNFIFILLGMLLGFTACNKKDDTSSEVPNTTVNLSININTPAYNSLANINGIAYISNEGYRGLILYRYSSTTILAYDRTCTYDLPDGNGIVSSLSDGTATCADCGSVYNLNDGSVYSGPTTLGLKKYNTSFNSNTGILVITN